MIAFNEGDGISWLGLKWYIFSCLLLDGEKFGVAFGRRSSSLQCKLMFVFIFSVCHLMKPWWYWHSFFCRMWVSRVGVVGMYVKTSSIHTICSLLKSIDLLCQFLFRRTCHSDEGANLSFLANAIQIETADEHSPSMSNAF